MVIVRLKFKKGIQKKIKESQKIYTYICPIDNVSVDDYVLCEVKIRHHNFKNDTDFRVGRIVEVISDQDEMQEIIKKEKPYAYVFCKIPVKDFDRRCREIKHLKYRRVSKYNGTYRKSSKTDK